MAVGVAVLGVLVGCGGDGGGTGPVAEGPEVAAGRALTEQRNCLSCHSRDGRRLAGPTWKGLAGSEVRLTDGRTVVADREYLRRSILDPNAEIVAGFAPGLMSSNIRGGPLTEAEADAIVAYLETVR
jgi:cytochrome c551/c552